ncbi:MAG TPA: putative 4-mercaptohistidine N1-methyltransferase [Thiobacillaceae bacterium]|nr:putative 4-mercaptohistidine N1-methyltransferase [Thiobacillaceae bacterium]HNU65112.1 putative 4-mercaptohistidine N1-methyltransferase [Thiobacillaceae bacterium]
MSSQTSTGTPRVIHGGVYESDAQLAQYCEFHYGPEYLGVGNFPATCAHLCLRAMDGRPARRALDLGCAVGRASFELARGFDHVDGVDACARFIRLARSLQAGARVSHVVPGEGELGSRRTVHLRQLGLTQTRARVAFQHGDACALAPGLDAYDLILAANLIDRLRCPRRLLGQIHARLRQGGLLILTSPYTWLTAFTPKEEWLGGFLRQGRAVHGLQGLHEVLDAHFLSLGEPRQIPFVIRETARKYQHTLAEMSIWEKR